MYFHFIEIFHWPTCLCFVLNALSQTLWRCYAAEKPNGSAATWKMYVLTPEGVAAAESDRRKHNFSVIIRFLKPELLNNYVEFFFSCSDWFAFLKRHLWRVKYVFVGGKRYQAFFILFFLISCLLCLLILTYTKQAVSPTLKISPTSHFKHSDKHFYCFSWMRFLSQQFNLWTEDASALYLLTVSLETAVRLWSSDLHTCGPRSIVPLCSSPSATILAILRPKPYRIKGKAKFPQTYTHTYTHM